MTGRARVGLDVLDRGELRRLLGSDWFLRYCYAPAELERAGQLGPERRQEFLAGRFAAKEAVLKVLGKGLLQGIPPRDIYVHQSEDGAPEVRLRGPAAELAPPDSELALSIAHKEDVVTAVAINLPSERTEQRTETTPDTLATAHLRVRIGQEDAHYGGGIVDGAHILKIFGDLVTEITIQTDGDEGLLAEYSKIKFTAPVKPGDFIEARARLVRRTRLRRVVELEAHKVIAAGAGPSKAEVLDKPQPVCTATATTVIPAPKSTDSQEPR